MTGSRSATSTAFRRQLCSITIGHRKAEAEGHLRVIHLDSMVEGELFCFLVLFRHLLLTDVALLFAACCLVRVDEEWHFYLHFFPGWQEREVAFWCNE